MSDTANDKAGLLPPTRLEAVGRVLSDDDKKLVQNTVFYLQEITKLYPKGAHMAFIASWDHGDNQRETINLGTLSNIDVINLLLDVERARNGVMGSA